MIWFFAFTSLGLLVTFLFLSLKWVKRLGWLDWIGGLGSLALFAVLAHSV